MTVVPPNALPLGYRFHPTEEELVGHYLKRKIGGVRTAFDVIPEIDVYKYEPWDLPDKSLIRSEDPEWFFFSQKDRKYPTGHRSNRATKAGYWKATGRDREIRSKGPASPSVIGMKKILVFHLGRAPKGVNTSWIMHEYRCSQPEYVFGKQGGYALYRLFRKVEEKNVYCRSDGSILYPLPPKASPGGTQHEEDGSEEIDSPMISKPILLSLVPVLKVEQKFLPETVENQSSGIKRWLSDNEDHASLKVDDGYCNNHMALDVEGNHEVKGGSMICDPKSHRLLITTAEAEAAAAAATTTKLYSNDDPPTDVIPTSGDSLAPIGSAAQVELTDNQTNSSESSREYVNDTVVEDSASLLRLNIYPSSEDPNLCHATADGSSSSCKLVDTEDLHPSRSPLANKTQKLKFEGKMMAVPPEVLPLGFRFHPTDVELVSHFLKRKLNGQIGEIDIIPEIDICKCEPWDLPYKSPLGLDASEWFFFSSKDKKYPTGNRSNRATTGGYWKVSGRDRAVRSKSPAARAVIGMKKSLIYYQGRAPKGVHTHWVMHEYRATEPEFEYGEQAGLVIYRLFQKGDEKNQTCTGDETERSGLSSSPTKSSPGDTENEGETVELDAPKHQVSVVSDLQQERQSLSNTVENQSSGITTCMSDKADFSSLKLNPEGRFNDNLVVVDLDSDNNGKVGETLVSRCLSSLFTSTARRKPPPEIFKVGPIASAAPAAFSADPTSVLSMPNTVTRVNESTTLSRINIRPSGIDLSLRRAQPSGHIIDNEESHPSSSTLVGQIQERCSTALCSHLTAIAARASSCNNQLLSGVVSTDSSHISVHLRLLRTLFSKSLAELTLELLKDGAESAKVVSSASGMQKDLAKHLQSVIDQAYALRVHLDQQNHIIGLNLEPIDQLERLEADMPRLTARLESLQLDIDRTAALVLQRRLQSGGTKDNLAELREELGRLSSDVACKERQMKKLRAEKPRHELTVTLASNFIKKLEADYAALAEPFRDYFVPGN
ncbi:NAC domain-containing protein 62-like [Iris pallida]|uniref:NAC domain-containing protein 62-like n=1 Tax=Iris pallida TaxID=29817 RepID=A0AAX6DZP6_IRIPA|nr:NAC domain-containing protein 62-like [Iris pallida]KAJ6817154.1 NAC domain-containing protein 62-like [Iris pallida]